MSVANYTSMQIREQRGLELSGLQEKEGRIQDEIK
jgi:hypothetical protein